MEGAAVNSEVDAAPDWGNGASESGSDDLGGFLTGGDQGVALRNAGEQGGYIGSFHYLQKGVGGVVTKATHLAGCVVERQSFGGAERPDQGLVKALFSRHAKMLLVPKENQTHDSPEIIDPIRVVERHAPAERLGWETPKEQNPGALREEGLKGVFFDGRRAWHLVCLFLKGKDYS